MVRWGEARWGGDSRAQLVMSCGWRWAFMYRIRGSRRMRLLNKSPTSTDLKIIGGFSCWETLNIVQTWLSLFSAGKIAWLRFRKLLEDQEIRKALWMRSDISRPLLGQPEQPKGWISLCFVVSLWHDKQHSEGKKEAWRGNDGLYCSSLLFEWEQELNCFVDVPLH